MFRQLLQIDQVHFEWRFVGDVHCLVQVAAVKREIDIELKVTRVTFSNGPEKNNRLNVSRFSRVEVLAVHIADTVSKLQYFIDITLIFRPDQERRLQPGNVECYFIHKRLVPSAGRKIVFEKLRDTQEIILENSIQRLNRAFSFRRHGSVSAVFKLSLHPPDFILVFTTRQ